MMSTNKSRPEYVRLAPDLHGTRHWFITNGASAEDCVRASLALAGLAPMEVWEVQDPKRHGAGVTFHEARESTFADDASLFAALDEALRDPAVATVGLRLYVLGSEPFIWSVQAKRRNMTKLQLGGIIPSRTVTLAMPSEVLLTTLAGELAGVPYMACPAAGAPANPRPERGRQREHR